MAKELFQHEPVTRQKGEMSDVLFTGLDATVTTLLIFWPFVAGLALGFIFWEGLGFWLMAGGAVANFAWVYVLSVRRGLDLVEAVWQQPGRGEWKWMTVVGLISAVLGALLMVEFQFQQRGDLIELALGVVCFVFGAVVVTAGVARFDT